MRIIPHEQPPSHTKLRALADAIIEDAQDYCGRKMSAADASQFRANILTLLIEVRDEASRAWLGSALTRARGDD